MSYTMAGRRVLITGASSGVGAALARMLAARGTTVGLIARRRDRLEEVLADCRKTSPQSVMWVADLCDTAGAARLALQAWQAMGGIDVLINNAAIPKRREVSALRPTEVEQVMGVNFFAPMRMTLALLPRMLARGSGTIVNVSSVGGRLGIIHESAYCASKFALCGWSESIAVDLAGSGVSVRLIQPGPVDTEIWDRPDNEDPLYRGPKVPADLVAEGIIAAIGSDCFEHYLPEMMALKDIVDAKNADLDTFLTAAAAMTWQ